MDKTSDQLVRERELQSLRNEQQVMRTALGVLGLIFLLVVGVLWLIWGRSDENGNQESQDLGEETVEDGTGETDAEDASTTPSIDTTNWITHTSMFWSGGRIAYECPSDWIYVSNTSFAECTSPSGSVFKYFTDSDWTGEYIVCDEDGGDVRVDSEMPLLDMSNRPIGEVNYLRRYNGNSGEWYVCQLVSGGTDYVFDPGSEAILLKPENDLELLYLDEILKSVRGVDDGFML